MANPDKTKNEEVKVIRRWKVGRWVFSNYIKTPGVIIANTKVKGYDEDWLCMIEEELISRRYRVFIDRSENETYSKKKKRTGIEVYRKFNDGEIKDNISDMLADLEEVFSMEVPVEDEEEDDE